VTRSRSGPQPHSETLRQWVHIAFGTVAIVLRYLPWSIAAIMAACAVVFNIRLLRHFTRNRLHREHELNTTLPAGLVLYPTSVLVLLLMFPSRPDIVAASWGILAAGDGAATLVGRRFGVRKWPWNRQKSVAGSVALFLAGGAAGAFLAWWCRSATIPPPYLWFSIGAPFAAALVAAAAETVPIRLDDNVSVPFSAAVVLWTLSLVSEDLVVSLFRTAPAALLIAIPANAAVAAAGYAARTVSVSGAIVGALIGVTIFLCAGWQGWIMLLASFLCAAVTSRLGLERKTLLGIAEEQEGRRGAGNAIANTGVAACAAVLAALSYAHDAGLIALVAALTAGASDTAASEIGKAWARTTWSIVPFRSVAPGTPGAMSLEGTAAGVAAAGALAALAIALSLVPAYALMPIVAAAMLGALVESLLAATFEGPGVLNNDALNLINTGVAAYVAVSIVGLLS
jgi:uncharacterized protein (TIGR00297 family)